MNKVKWDEKSRTYRWSVQGKERYQSAHSKEEEPEDNVAFLDCWERAEKATWWNWDGGSRIHFWRWNEEYLGHLACVKDARDGARVLFTISGSCLQINKVNGNQRIHGISP
jgi:hypothetical protein